MAWGFRRSLRFGGLRFTFSRSGISTSVGAPGFRVTSGPRGVYVTTGFKGFYYRQRAGRYSRPRSTSPTVRPAPHREPTFYATETYESAHVGRLTDVSQEDFVRSLNEWTSRGMLQVLTAVLAGIILLGMLAISTPPMRIVEAATYATIAFLLARYVEMRRRRFLLVYDLGPAEASQYERLRAALATLANSGCLRGVRTIGDHGDWKRHGGATRSLSFVAMVLRAMDPPYVVSNLRPYGLVSGALTMFFYPDRILIRSHGKFAALSYEALDVERIEGSFVWDEALPHDAQVIGQTWLYVRRDGGPDRRFNNNRQIPIVRVGYLHLRSATGLDVALQSSHLGAVEAFACAERSYAGQAPKTQPAVPNNLDADTRAAIEALGLTGIPRRSDLKRAYRDLVARNHPDRFHSGPRELLLFAEERMKEINSAYEKLESKALADSSGPVEMPPPAERPTSPDRRPTAAWRSPEAVATAGAVLLATCACVSFRLLPERASAPARVQAAPMSLRSSPAAVAPVATPRPPQDKILLNCPLRSSPASDASRINRIRSGTPLDVLERRDGWRRVRLPSGQEGWTGPACWRPAQTRRPAVMPSAMDAGPALQLHVPADGGVTLE